jgi:putative SOS response-associated peptidase YedK
MCGRYTISHSTEEILERFQILAEKIAVEPSYNVAPSNMVPVVVAEAADVPEEPTSRLLQLCKWGLVPFWVKDLKGAKPLINARAESLTEKAAFKQALIKHRCVIPADGFYEWKKQKNAKIPMRMKLTQGKLFGFAGIYQDWKAPDGTLLRTCAIITVPANNCMKDIHDRMPAILTGDAEAIWLDPDVEDEDALAHCLRPYPHDDLEAYVVSTKVNKPNFNSPELIEPISQEEQEESNLRQAEAVAQPKTRKKRAHPEDPLQLKLPI